MEILPRNHREIKYKMTLEIQAEYDDLKLNISAV